MKVYVYLTAFFLFCANNAWSQNISENPNCFDSTYLRLKKENINKLTPREYEYLLMKEKMCSQINTNSIQSSDTLVKNMDCDESKAAGRKFAQVSRSNSAAQWYLFGTGAGFLGGLIGGGIVITLASASNPEPDSVGHQYDVQCYKKGYKKDIKQKRIIGSICGTITGTALVVLLFLLTSSK